MRRIHSRLAFASLAVLCSVVISSSVEAASKLRISVSLPPGTKDYKAIKSAASKVRSVTAGRVDFDWVELDPMKQDATDELFAGRLDLALMPSAALGEHVPATSIMALPLLFRDLDEAAAIGEMVEGDVERGLAQAGMTTLAQTGIGFTYLMAVEPVKRPDDLKRARLWLPEGQAFSSALSGAGARVVQLPMNDLLPGLQKAKEGDADAPTTLIGWPSLVVARRWHTEITHVLDLPFFYVDTRLLGRSAALAGVSAADRATLVDEFGRAFQEIRGFQESYHQQYERALKRYGAAFHAPSASERAEWESFGRDWARRMATERGLDDGQLKRVEGRLAELRR